KYDRNLFDPKTIKEILSGKGFSAIETTAIDFLRTQRKKTSLSLLKRLAVALVLACGIGVSEHFSVFRLAGILCVVSVFWPGFPLLRRAFSFLFRGFLDSALPGVLVALFCLGYGIWGLFAVTRPFFLLPGLLILLLTLWELVEDWLSTKISLLLEGLVSRFALWARVQRGGRITEVPVDEVERDEILVVDGGERLPVDGIVVDGAGLTEQGRVSTSMRLRATTKLESGRIRVKATECFSDSYQVKLLLLAEEALSAGSTSRAYALLLVFSYLLIASSLIAAWFFGPGAVLLFALPLPQAISLATEWHRLAGVKKGLARGVIFKSANHLHRFGRTDVLLVPLGSALGDYRLCGLDGPPELIPVVSSLEQGLFSKLSMAFSPGPFPPTNRFHYKGMGVVGTIGGVSWRFGNIRFVKSAPAFPTRGDGLFPVFLESDGPECVFLFSREPRPGTQELMKAWKSKVLMSSAPRPTVEFWADRWGIRETYPESVPEGKKQVIADLVSQRRKVLYFDDVPHRHDILTAAYWGIAVVDDFIDIEAGNTVITGGDLSKIPLARRMAGRSNLA
ncbi:MAG: hypothetical protein ACPL68_06720, partial [Candidatus Hydrothermia bacterium]